MDSKRSTFVAIENLKKELDMLKLLKTKGEAELGGSSSSQQIDSLHSSTGADSSALTTSVTGSSQGNPDSDDDEIGEVDDDELILQQELCKIFLFWFLWVFWCVFFFGLLVFTPDFSALLSVRQAGALRRQC